MSEHELVQPFKFEVGEPVRFNADSDVPNRIMSCHFLVTDRSFRARGSTGIHENEYQLYISRFGPEGLGLFRPLIWADEWELEAAS